MIETRYPYTYSVDYLRSGFPISRSDASCIRKRISKALSINDKDLAEMLADEFLLG